MAVQYQFSHYIKITLAKNGKKFLKKAFSRGPLTIGSEALNRLQLTESKILPTHLAIEEKNDQFYIVYKGKGTGLLIDGEYHQSYTLKNAATVIIEDLIIIIEITDQTSFTLHESGDDIHSQETQVSGLPEEVSDTKPSLPPDARIEVKAPPQRKEKSKIPQPDFSASAHFGESVGHEKISELGHYHPNVLHGQALLPLPVENAFGLYPGVEKAKYHRLEATVIWQDQIHEVKEFYPEDYITVGSGLLAELKVPVLNRGWALGRVDMRETLVSIPKDKDFIVERKGQELTAEDMLRTQQAKPNNKFIQFKMGHLDVLDLDFKSGMKVQLRYVPAPNPLPRKKVLEPDYAIRQALIWSTVMHFLTAGILVVIAPKHKEAPVLKNVPERYARLLVEDPKPIIPVPPPPPPPEPEKPKPEPIKPEPKKIAKVEKPKPKKFDAPKKMIKQNKRVVTKTTSAPTPEETHSSPVQAEVADAPPVSVEALGALGALGPISNNPSKSPSMANIQINKNAGGAGSDAPRATGMLNALSAAGGKMAAAGMGRVKTGGKGIGSGKEYGTQGLSGAAGRRGVGGLVVGMPKLATAKNPGKPEGLTRAQVMEVVKKHMGEIQSCYERAMLSVPDLAGRIEFEWDIEPVGRVTSVRIKRSTVSGGDGLADCVKGVFMAMQFPKAKNGQSTTPNIGFPFGRQ